MTGRQYVLATMMSAVTATPPVSALAGDVATLNVLGFSESGSLFAFEEYGVQDGSGFPYANRFYIDTASDSFAPGSPVRVRIDDENATVGDARAQAKATGEAIVADAELQANAGFLAGFNSVTESSADPFRIVVNPRPVFPPVDPPLEIRLEEVPFASSGNCSGVTDADIGFRLLSVNATVGGVTELLHEDSSVPSSRACPTGYRIGGVQTFMPFQGPSAFAVLIAVRSFGFEGPDYRWMAVTRRNVQEP